MRRKNHTHQQDIDDLKKQNALLEQQGKCELLFLFSFSHSISHTLPSRLEMNNFCQMGVHVLEACNTFNLSLLSYHPQRCQHQRLNCSIYDFNPLLRQYGRQVKAFILSQLKLLLFKKKKMEEGCAIMTKISS